MSDPIVYVAVPSRDEVLSGHRKQEFTYKLLDRSGQVLGDLEGVEPGGSLTWTANQSVKGRGSLPFTDQGADINWLSARIGISLTVADVAGAGEPVTIGCGVWVPSIPKWLHEPGRTSATISLLSRETVLSRWPIRRVYSLPAGTVITTAVRALLAEAGEPAGAITDSTATLATDRTWPATATILQIINDLAKAGNFFSLYTDAAGQYRFTPYVKPSSRTRAWDFKGSKAVFVPKFTREQDLASVPNVLQVQQNAPGGTDPIIVEASNNDPASPFSTVARGVVAADPESIDAVDAATMLAYANRRLADLTNATAQCEADHLIVPMWFNDAAWFSAPRHNIDALHVISSTTIACKPTGLAKTIFREVLIDA